MDKENEKAAKLKRIKDISFKDGMLVPATRIKERAREYNGRKIQPIPEPAPEPIPEPYKPKGRSRGRPKGYRPKCKKCGQLGHMAKTCKQEDEILLRGWLFDE